MRWPLCRTWRRDTFTSNVLYHIEDHAASEVFTSTASIGVFGVEIPSGNKCVPSEHRNRVVWWLEVPGRGGQ